MKKIVQEFVALCYGVIGISISKKSERFYVKNLSDFCIFKIFIHNFNLIFIFKGIHYYKSYNHNHGRVNKKKPVNFLNTAFNNRISQDVNDYINN